MSAEYIILLHDNEVAWSMRRRSSAPKPMGGFYLVETAQLETLAKLVNELLADTTGPAKIRATTQPGEGS